MKVGSFNNWLWTDGEERLRSDIKSVEIDHMASAKANWSSVTHVAKTMVDGQHFGPFNPKNSDHLAEYLLYAGLGLVAVPAVYLLSSVAVIKNSIDAGAHLIAYGLEQN